MTDFQSIFALSGKTAILTGATGNLGPYFARALASFGANVALLDLHEAQLQKLAADISLKTSTRCSGHACDITDPAAVSAVVEEVIAAHSSVDILVNNAQAADAIVSFEDTSLDEWRKTSSINEEGTFLMSQAVGKKMISQKSGGSLINISSIYGVMAPDHRIYKDAAFKGNVMGSPAVYSVTKAGLIGLTRYLSTYWAEHKIRVNALTPGGVEGNQSDNFKQRYNNRIPLNRMARPDDLVGALVFLASDASSYVTGQNIIIDGGLNAW